MMAETPLGRRALHDELDRLQDRMVEMAGRVEEIIHAATHALLQRDPSAARAVKKLDKVVDALEVEVDERVLGILALQQPMAGDLRQVVSTLKVANDLERLGDHGVNIARAAKRISKLPTSLPEIPEVEEMVELAQGMLADALASFVSRNSGTARMVVVRDDRVDDLRRSLFRILVTHMLEDPRTISLSLELLLVSQNLERIADLSTNVAEDVVFLVEGVTIKHNAEAADDGP